MAQLTHQEVNTDGLVGKLVTPSGKGPFPGVLCIGGSSGGVSMEVADLLAQEGFAAFSVGYFGVSGLPETLADIPMEYFEKALTWLLAQPTIRGSKIGVIGTSRGSEAALQLAVLSSKVNTVAVYVPSGIRWNGVGGAAPWTYEGKPLPYVQRLTDYAHHKDDAVTKVDMYNKVLDNPTTYTDAVIEVEKASCPILLISGKDDQLWPSERMAEQVMKRLKKHNYSFTYRHLSYPNAGHRIKVPGLDESRYVPVSESTITHEVLNLGGTAEGSKLASEQSWPEVVQFFLRATTRHFSVGAAQVQDIQGNVPAALSIIREVMQKADEQNIDILCFPECFLQGYTLDHKETKQRALSLKSPQFQEILDQLSSYKVTAILGVIEKDSGDYFNTAVVIQGDKLLGKYRKVHLFEENFKSGEEYPVFTVSGITFGINICYDARFTEGATELAAQGARVIFYPLNNRLPTEKAEAYRDKHIPNLITRAKESGCWVVSSDVVHQSEDYMGYGCTAIVSPEGEVVARMAELESNVISVEVTT